MCRHEGYPLAPYPGANVFLTDRDVSTPPDVTGDAVITCKPIGEATGARKAYSALRALERLAIEVGELL